ncbi:glycine--tRNA ligase, partial [Candidatus Dojkabacteria bacterium]|nr:glycine--tRNA ligase [Candidatus Dojkabacteria bacterium]
KEEIVKKARDIFTMLSPNNKVVWDDRGNIGKRYRYQDEIGTPFCITVDYESLENDTVTVRDRDTMEQKRVKIEDLDSVIN